MSEINSYLEGIRTAVYGREVRSSIANAIEQCYTDTQTGATAASEAASQAAATIEGLQTSVNNKLEQVDTKLDLVDSKLNTVDDKITASQTAITNANSAAASARTAITEMRAEFPEASKNLMPSWNFSTVAQSSGELGSVYYRGNTVYVSSDLIDYDGQILFNPKSLNKFYVHEYKKDSGEYVGPLNAGGFQSNIPRRLDGDRFQYRIETSFTDQGLAAVVGSSDSETRSLRKAYIQENIIPAITDYLTLTKAEHCIFQPIKDYFVGDTIQRIYMNELAEYNKAGYFKVTPTYIASPRVRMGWNEECQYLEFDYTDQSNPSRPDDSAVRIDYYYENVLCNTTTITIHVHASNIVTGNFIFIGDSLTANGNIVKRFKDLNPGVTLYGTNGSGGYLHEGRGSWSVGDYMNPSKGNTTNPFYNPDENVATFDFSYYISQHPEFADVDCVVIFLGRNNSGFQSDVLMTYLQSMIESIKNYNNGSVRCYVLGGYNVACNDTATGLNMNSSNDFIHRAHVYNRTEFYPTFLAADSLAKPIPAHLALDNKWDYAMLEKVMYTSDDGTVTRSMMVYDDDPSESVNNAHVHPNDQGYRHLGEAISGFFHFEVLTWENS